MTALNGDNPCRNHGLRTGGRCSTAPVVGARSTAEGHVTVGDYLSTAECAGSFPVHRNQCMFCFGISKDILTRFWNNNFTKIQRSKMCFQVGISVEWFLHRGNSWKAEWTNFEPGRRSARFGKNSTMGDRKRKGIPAMSLASEPLANQKFGMPIKLTCPRSTGHHRSALRRPGCIL